MKTADDFCILPLPAHQAHSAGFAWQEKTIILNSTVFFCFPFSILAGLRSLSWLSYELFAQQDLCSGLCFSKNWKNPFMCSLFFFFFWSSSPIGSCSLYACRQGGAYLSCGKLPYKNWGCFFHYPRAFLASWRRWWQLQVWNSVCSPRNEFRSSFHFSSSKGRVFECGFGPAF